MSELSAKEAVLGTKAETLNLLYQKLKRAKVLPQLSFTRRLWEREQDSVLVQYRRLAWNENVIVRSSSLSEDTVDCSQAGKFESIANVRGEQAFVDAVNRVIASYDDESPENQILVQPMLENVNECGVAFTLEPNTLGNYYVINYDSTGSTDAITSGVGNSNRLYYHFKQASPEKAPEGLRDLIYTLQELEQFFRQDNLDVEFAITSENELYVLQVRALCAGEKRISIDAQRQALERIAEKIRRDQSPKPFLCGKRTLYSVMTDWNPAEMIGVRPKPLALSLYREIITDNIWAYQRDNYGYRNLRSVPLMVDFCGLPYIDVRASFNSFVPAELDDAVSEKLVNYYLDRLAEKPENHDKAEFEIVFSCYTLDLPERIQVLADYGFDQEEIEKIMVSLRNVTNHIIDHKDGLWRKDYEKIKLLEQRYDEIMSSDMDEIEKVYWLLEDCKRYGTLPFAGLARAAFIAVQLLRSLVTCEILTKEDYESFMNGVNTVSSIMNRDFAEMSKAAFLKKYGHLRPGTYDINSLRYDEASELYFDWNADSALEQKKELFRLSLRQLNDLREKLIENGLTNDVLEFMDFIRIVIEGREYGKFAFTKNLSQAIQLIGEIGGKAGLPKSDCAYINIQIIRDLYTSTYNMQERLVYDAQRGKQNYTMTQALILPPFLADTDTVMRFFYPDSEPNFIASGNIQGEVILLEQSLSTEDISDKIVLIPSADPGYDWIFSHGIKGFITMYGGANSHMAIRAGELGLPAVVGVGGKMFERYQHARILEIDAAEKIIRILK